MKPVADQLSLFGGAPGPDPAGPEPVVTDAQRSIAARLPPNLYLGTSSWTFPGWAGIVYAGHPSMDKLVERGLEAYAKHPLFRTVGVDRSYYAPLSEAQWRAYAGQLPSGFLVACKALSEVTAAVFPDHPRFGERAGLVNPSFLDPRRALVEVARPFLEGLGEHAGTLVFELAPIPDRLLPPEAELLARLGRLFDAMPAGLRLAVELRTPRLLTPRYLDFLRDRGVSHVLNYWTGMPTPGEQAAAGADDSDADLIFRLLLPPGGGYETLRAEYEPFDRLRVERPDLRDHVVAITRRALARGRRAFVLVGNKAEGSAPLTVFALAAQLAEAGP